MSQERDLLTVLRRSKIDMERNSHQESVSVNLDEIIGHISAEDKQNTLRIYQNT